MVNYKVGDIVIKKEIDIKKKQYADRYMFIGTSNDTKIKSVAYTMSVMGKVEIGIFVKTPVEINDNEGINHCIYVEIYSTELFEKDE